MKYLAGNTLNYFQSAPQRHPHVNLGNIPVSVLATNTKEYRVHCGRESPDHQAIRFYAYNHCASLVSKKFTKNEPLPEWATTVMKTYSEELSSQSLRMTHYLLSIVTREARHLKNPSPTLVSDLTEAGGPAMLDFLQSIRQVGEDNAVSKYMSYPPEVTLEKYVKSISVAFYKGTWAGGYGGKAWGLVTDTLLSMVQGKTSLEMMVDTAYTMAHNNGPIFNKGMMYEKYSSEFIKVLDIQRAGLIPELLLDTQGYLGLSLPLEACNLVKLVNQNLPGEFEGKLWWKNVQAAGAVGNYGHLITKQEQEVLVKGNTAPIKAAIKKATTAKKAALSPDMDYTIEYPSAKVTLTGLYSVLPGFDLPTFEREVE